MSQKKDHETEAAQPKSSTKTLHDKLNIETEELLTHPSYEELQQKLEEAEEKAAQNWDRALRIQAETDNIIRRAKLDIEKAQKYALEKFVSELLPVIDSLERSLIDSPEGNAAVLEGVELTLKMFYAALEKFAVEQVNPQQGETFNPELHQAVSVQPNEKVKPGAVLSVLQKGYLLNSRLVRPALVVVAK